MKQRKHIRTSKKGKKFVAGRKKNILTLRLDRNTQFGTIASGKLFYLGKEIAKWFEDSYHQIILYNITDLGIKIFENKFDSTDTIENWIKKEWRLAGKKKNLIKVGDKFGVHSGQHLQNTTVTVIKIYGHENDDSVKVRINPPVDGAKYKKVKVWWLKDRTMTWRIG
jgi:hypothetical protein